MKLALSLALMLIAAPALADTSAGIAEISGPTGRERPLALSIWYPTVKEPSVTIGGNAVFEGAMAAEDAPLPSGPLPLVVLSHGGLRSADNSGAWLGAALARAGFLVAEVNAPRPANAATGLDEIWQRPRDIGRALDLLLADGEWNDRIDPDRISVVGFALGGTAALSVAGADLNAARYLQSCDGGGPDCGWFAAQGVTLGQTDPTGLADLARDPRIASAVAIAPEYLSAMTDGPEAATLLIFLGPDAPDSPPVEVTRIVPLPEATLYDAFATCTPAGPSILREDGGDASICGDDPAVRDSAHTEIAQAIAAFLASREN